MAAGVRAANPLGLLPNTKAGASTSRQPPRMCTAEKRHRDPDLTTHDRGLDEEMARLKEHLRAAQQH